MLKITPSLLRLITMCSCAVPIFAVSAQQLSDTIIPETSVAQQPSQLVQGKQWMIASANHYASEAGAAILRQGGNAVDAMVATQLVLGLVEPQSSGIGGGGFLVYWDSDNHQMTTFDGRETAPFAVTPRLFQDKNGQPLAFYDAVVGGRSVGTPGTIKLLWNSHQQYGQLDWKKLFQPAIKLAKNGFIVSPRLAALVAKDATHLQRWPVTKNYFFDAQGKPIQAGQKLINQPYADTLRKIADYGQKAFYQGDIAREIVNTVQNAIGNPGVLSSIDLASYKVKQRAPICAPYHQYQICGMGPPSSGALTLGQIMAMLNHFPLAKMGANDIASWRLIGDASRLAFADRGRYMADSDYVPMPTKGLLDPAYIHQRAQLLATNKKLTNVEAGSPPWDHANLQTTDEAIELPSTTHFAIVDRQGNVVSMTSTIENSFGSRLMVGGFLLNNELTDFSFRSHIDGKPIANRIEPGKRPRSSMAPTIVMHNNQPVLAIGSPGGSQIIGYIAKTLVAYLDWGMDLQQAISLPNINNRFGPFELEQNTSATAWAPKFEQLGYKTAVKDLNSGIQAISIAPQQLIGAADPRREGKVIAQ
ncbi:gamma-glutamyltransferase [Photobacterium iliopiscarium]|jgi:gamma-glutamyltranspeptidase/glutathione hydrolase|uniref:Glutathione hydrolase proenzyme n=2 Tax=Photobacterium iliopiscarium TaxID=56192 RepID=A0A0D8Q091_9GAMM|nr:gamma-glutamyltransferase [Photobacterium iliopiscarium]KJG22869.1 gamma-glutamyltransferase [Photobacterium iliopiscarium]PSV92914.1 gamma-glutamyltransferase [Photobacterium iliopiscarium]PSW96387.1 gamma-glutamyltransferase [Photobacterium iliopiscarium]